MSIWRETARQVPSYDLPVWVRASERGQPFKAARILHRKMRRGVWVRKRGKRGLAILRDAPVLWAGIGKAGEPIDPGPEPPPDAMPPAFFEWAKRSSVVRALDDGRDGSPEPRDWWRDGYNLTYSPRGAVTPREVEGRLMRALMTINATTKLDNPRGAGSNSDWIARQIERVERENGKRETYWHARFQPTARDVSDCAVVLDWIMGLWLFDDRYHTVLSMRAADPPYSWRQIGESISRSQAGTQAIYKRAISFAVRRANGVEPKQRRRYAAAQTVSP